MKERQVILSGCSGGGKTTLLAELARRGFPVVEEPGRRIVAEEMRGDSAALPWVDLAAFARRAIAMAKADRARVAGLAVVFFDRGLVDAAVALEHSGGAPLDRTLAGQPRFHCEVFLVPPWPEIYRADAERQAGLEEGVAEYHRLRAAYDRLGYQTVILPKVPVAARADLVLARLGLSKAEGPA